MKIRKGYVSNSSSSSFVIHKGFITEEQIANIFDYVSIAQEYLEENPLPEDDFPTSEFDFSYLDDTWKIKEFDDCIFGETSMDNFYFHDFFRYIGVDPDNVYWDDGYIDEPTSSQRNFINSKSKKLRKLKLKNLDDEKRI